MNGTSSFKKKSVTCSAYLIVGIIPTCQLSGVNKEEVRHLTPLNSRSALGTPLRAHHLTTNFLLNPEPSRKSHGTPQAR